MDGVKQQIIARQAEASDKRHTYEMKQKRREMRSELDQLNSKNKSDINEIKKDYDRKVLDEKNQAEIKLTQIRSKNNEVIKDEEKKFEKMIQDIKLTHTEKINELKNSQQKEIEKTQENHQDFLETAQNKFETEKAKLEV